jgi:DNA-binding NarL/FixJ family response regulator/tetratricopeptide (TPR) repeat protein
VSEQGLVGRGAELALIAELLDALPARSSGPILELSGEPGIGKSSLLRALIDGAHDRGYLVLAGRAAEFQAELPFGMFLDAMDDWLTGLDSDRLSALAGDLAAELATVFPAFVPLAAGEPVRLPEERYRAYRALRAMLSAIAEDTPVVLVLDDLHWADPAAVELLCHLLARPATGAVMLAVAFRPAQLSRPLSGALASVVVEHRATRIDLELLTARSARELLDGSVSPATAAALYRESGGNPFFLLQLARGAALADREAVPHPELSPTIPEAVRLALASELSSLSAPALVLLQGAAVAGDPFEVPLAAAAADIGADDAFDAVDELLAFQLVSPTRIGSRFAFRHPIVRATVYESAASGWLARAHARLAAFLAARGAGPSAQAPHVERSASTGDRSAVALLAAAGAQGAPRAPALAARWYGSALRLLPSGSDAEPERIELLIAMAIALGGSGQLEESRRALVQVLEHIPSDDPGRIAVVAYCAQVEHLLGRHRRAQHRLSQAHLLVAGQLTPDVVALKLELAAGGGFECRADEMLYRAQAALTAAEQIDRPTLELAAAGQVALAEYFLGSPTVGAAMDRAAARFDALDDTELAERLDVGIWVGWTEAVLERHDRAVADCRRVIEVARATGQGAFLPLTATAMGWSLIRQGRLEEADDTLTEAIESGRLTPNLFFAIAVGLSGVVATQRGDLAAAVRAGEECFALSSASDPGLIPGMCGVYLAIPLIELGEAERARDAVLARAGGPELPLMSRSGHTTAYEVLTRAELLLGRTDAAEEWARRAQDATHGGRLRIETAFARRALAAVALARDDAPEAARIALAAAAETAAAGAPAEAARCRILAARALLHGGDRTGAVAEFELAARELGRVGALGYQAEAERELRRLGRRVRRQGGAPAVPALASLTAREQEVAELVRRGHTNREIAAATILSERTVERHLSHIFTKLGVSNRSALASLVAEADQNA